MYLTIPISVKFRYFSFYKRFNYWRLIAIVCCQFRRNVICGILISIYRMNTSHIKQTFIESSDGFFFFTISFNNRHKGGSIGYNLYEDIIFVSVPITISSVYMFVQYRMVTELQNSRRTIKIQFDSCLFIKYICLKLVTD